LRILELSRNLNNYGYIRKFRKEVTIIPIPDRARGKIKIRLLIFIVMAIMLCLFCLPTGIGEALLLGLTAVAADWFWQRWRWWMFKKHGPRNLVIIVFGGLVLRLANVLTFVGIGMNLLQPAGFKVFGCFLLTIPLSNLLIPCKNQELECK